MEIEEAGGRAVGALEVRYDDSLVAGVQAVGEFRCAGCGYGVIVHRELPPCPMCGSTVWEESAWRPFSRARAAETLQ